MNAAWCHEAAVPSEQPVSQSNHWRTLGARSRGRGLGPRRQHGASSCTSTPRTRSGATREASVLSALKAMGLPVPGVIEEVVLDGRPGLVLERVGWP